MFKLKETVELKNHQAEFVDVFRTKKVMGLFDTPGTGKTLEILAAICDRCEEGDTALVVVPPHLLANWHYEVDKFTYLEIGKDIDIVPYTQLGKKCDNFLPYRLVAADEAHYLKNMDAKRTFNFMNYLEASIVTGFVEYFIFATGTPVENRIPDIYTFLFMIAGFEHVSPKIDVRYPTYYEFCERFCHVKSVTYGSGVKYHGMKNLDELKEYLKPWTIRRSLEESFGMENQSVIASYSEDSELAQAWEEHASDGSVGGVDIKAKKAAAVAKAPFTAKWVTDELISGSGPIVIFSDHVESAEIIYEDLKSCKFKVALIKGGVDMKVRDKIVKDFQAGLLDAIVCTSAGYTGLTLTRSNMVVFNDVPWIPSSLDQARKRIDRLTQTRRCRCIYIVGSRADDQIIEMLKAKIKVIRAVVEV